MATRSAATALLDNDVITLLHRGELDAAEGALTALAAKLHETDHGTRGRIEVFRGEIATMRGELANAVNRYRAAISHLQRSQLVATEARARRNLAKALLTLESARAATDELRAAAKLVNRIDDETIQTRAELETAVLGGLIALGTADIESAKECAAAAQSLIGKRRTQSNTPEARRRRATALPVDSDEVATGMYLQLSALIELTDNSDESQSRGRQGLEQAASHFRTAGLVYHEARALDALARALVGTNRTYALDTATQALGLYNKAGASFLADRTSTWIESERVRSTKRPGRNNRHAAHLLDPTTTEYNGILITGPATTRTVELTMRYGRTEQSVLITGETGTGKELHARSVHAESSRREGPFIAVNCGAIVESLAESELFGHRKGAFTNAHADRKGVFELAEGGTVFLDEVGEALPTLQVKLLRVIQEREIVPVGGTKPIHVDVRIIAATNNDLANEIVERRFREDLFHRLNANRIQLAPLREHPREIGILARRLLASIAKRRGIPGAWITHSAIERLEEYDWPGNVRELEETLDRLLATTLHECNEPRISDGYVREAIEESQRLKQPVSCSSREHPDVSQGDLARMLEAAGWAINSTDDEPYRALQNARKLIEHDLNWSKAETLLFRHVATTALIRHNGSVRRCCAELGISQETFYTKAKRSGLERLTATAVAH